MNLPFNRLHYNNIIIKTAWYALRWSFLIEQIFAFYGLLAIFERKNFAKHNL